MSFLSGSEGRMRYIRKKNISNRTRKAIRIGRIKTEIRKVEADKKKNEKLLRKAARSRKSRDVMRIYSDAIVRADHRITMMHKQIASIHVQMDRSSDSMFMYENAQAVKADTEEIALINRATNVKSVKKIAKKAARENRRQEEMAIVLESAEEMAMDGMQISDDALGSQSESLIEQAYAEDALEDYAPDVPRHRVRAGHSRPTEQNMEEFVPKVGGNDDSDKKHSDDDDSDGTGSAGPSNRGYDPYDAALARRKRRPQREHSDEDEISEKEKARKLLEDMGFV